ncbi:hypothetical protein QA601_13680 [Chitinispirillales bacterium ANBcel5]|uniref:hypothetical protein n=1 Tax=Cellulosispirillum alkaliphilum TaxID=3039283 RepID=UPI002A52188A|nr:hypothetical protein [Chitinispirillales bacterium ANBcel5]
MNLNKSTIFVLSLIIFPLISGCTKEKAEAIKNLSLIFREEASESLNQIKTIILKSVEMPAQDVGAVVKDLESIRALNDEKLTFLIDEAGSSNSNLRNINQELQSLEEHYYLFASIFSSLPQGHLFASDAIERAQKYSKALTIRMINLADDLHRGSIQVRSNAKRIALIEQINDAKKIDNDSLRRKKLEVYAQEIIAVAKEEKQIKERAIIQCLKTASIGKELYRLIENYRDMDIQQILAMTNNAIERSSMISVDNKEIVSLLNRFRNYQSLLSEKPQDSSQSSTPATIND